MQGLSSETAGFINGWKVLGDDLGERFCRPWMHVTFVVYFGVGVLAFGGLGIWFEWIRWGFGLSGAGPGGVLTAIITCFPALVGSSSLQMILEGDRDRRMRAFAIACAFIFLCLGALLVFGRMPMAVKYVLAVGGSAAALWFWWIANAYNPGLQDVINDQAAVGGDPTATPPGSLDGFTT